VRIGEAVHGLSEEMADVGLTIQRVEDKTEKLRARSLAIDELAASGVLTDLTRPGEDRLGQELRQISASQNVEAELAALKQRLGQGAQPKPLGRES
jgi:phage shock protein A